LIEAQLKTRSKLSLNLKKVIGESKWTICGGSILYYGKRRLKSSIGKTCGIPII
jgi:hypothetical protein